MSLRLHAITLADAGHVPTPTDGRHTGAFAEVRDDITFVPFRDLSAVVSDRKGFALEELTPADVDQHRAIVDGLFRRAAVLPAPVGAVFRSAAVLTRWVGLHRSEEHTSELQSRFGISY